MNVCCSLIRVFVILLNIIFWVCIQFHMLTVTNKNRYLVAMLPNQTFADLIRISFVTIQYGNTFICNEFRGMFIRMHTHTMITHLDNVKG